MARVVGNAGLSRDHVLGTLGLILLAVGIGTLPVQGDKLRIITASGLVIVAALLSAYRLRKDPLDAAGLYGAVAAVVFGLSSLAWLGAPPSSGPNPGTDAIFRGLLVVTAALGCFGIGVRLVAGRARPRPTCAIQPSTAPSPAALVGMFTVGLMGTAVGLVLGTYGYRATLEPPEGLLPVMQLTIELAAIGPLVVLAAAIAYFGTQAKRYRALLYALLAVQVTVGFIAGFKGSSVFPVLLVLGAYIACRGRVPWRAIAVLILATLVVLFPANFAYRTVINTSSDEETVSPSAREILGGTPAATYRALLTRFRMIDSVAVIVDQTPSVYPYGNGYRYFALPQLILVPRALWPDKPILNQGVEFSHTYWQLPLYAKTSTIMTQPGDLYRNFSLPGVILGMLIWGAAIGGFVRLSRRFHSPRVEMVYLFLLINWIVAIERPIPLVVAGIAKALPFVGAVAWLLLPNRNGTAGYRMLADWVRGRRRRNVVASTQLAS